MEFWHLVLYAAASLLAVRSLLSLMTAHRRQYRRQLMKEYQRELHRERADRKKGLKQKPAEAESTDAAA